MPSLMDLPLRDIHVPDPVSWWPPALGWWLLIGASILLAVAITLLVRKFLKSSLKKEASRELDGIERRFIENEDASQCLSELSIFLRRARLSQKDSWKCAGVTGEAWLALLDEPLGRQAFSQGAGRLLLAGPYLPQVEKEDVADLIKLCRQWVKSL